MDQTTVNCFRAEGCPFGMRQIGSDSIPQLAEFLKRQKNPQAVRILTWLRAYGVKYPFCVFYSLSDGVDIVGAAVVRGSSVIGYLTQDSLVFASFCQTIAATEISVNRTISLQQKYQQRSGRIFYYSQSPQLAAVRLQTGKYQVCYQILKEAFPSFSTPFDEWYCEICHMVRHQEGMLLQNNQQATFFLTGLSSPLAVGQHLAVRPSEQRNGIGKELLQAAAAYCFGRNQKICCYSKNAASDLFYRSVGWLEQGKWYEYQQKGDSI